jgi:D-alanine--poly(phosphoribitol) ligase subunit 2
MTDDLILQNEVALLLFENLHVEAPSVHDDLIEDGLLDSLKIVELLVELESRFVLRIPFEDLEIDSFRSVANIARLIAHLRDAAAMVNAPVSAASGALRLPAAD